MRRVPLKERILRRVVVDDQTQCWLWQGCVTKAGYGLIGSGDERKNISVHRAAYEVFVGPIPEGLHLDHLCRVRTCVNPDHLEPVTHTENARRGAGTRLTPDDVRAIREDPRPSSAVGPEFGVTPSAVRHIRRGERWAA